jgi:DNA-binding transcriptional LysR family regulator
MLAVNDQILGLVAPGNSLPLARIGIPGDFAASILPKGVAEFQARTAHLRFQLRGDPSESLLRDLDQGQLDLAVALTTPGPAVDPRHCWREEMVWIKGPGATLDAGARLSVVAIREGGLMHRMATGALGQAGRDYEIAFTAFSTAALGAAVSAGLGIALLPRRDVPPDVRFCDETFLPKPPEVYCGIYLREGIDCPIIETLADTLAEALRPRSDRVLMASQGFDTAHAGAAGGRP